VASGWASACSSFESTDDPSAGDAAVDNANGGDSARDSPDASPSIDAEAGPAPCATAHDFCADFDTVAAVGDTWSTNVKSGTGKDPAFAMPSSAPSPPRVMQSEIEVAASDSGVGPLNYSVLAKTATLSGATRSRVDIAFDFNAVAMPANPDRGPFIMRIFDPEVWLEIWRPSASNTLTMRLYFRDNFGNFAGHVLSATPLIGEWHHVAVHLDARAAEKDEIPMSIQVNGAAKEDFKLIATPFTGAFACDVGAYAGEFGVTSTVQHDNVTMDWK
jgi:hypothetical protein